MERARDIRGRDYKVHRNIGLLGTNSWEGGGPKSARISVEQGKELQTKWMKRKESLEGLVGAASWKGLN